VDVCHERTCLSILVNILHILTTYSSLCDVKSWTKQLTMDDTVTLILLSFAMLVGCYLAGSIPLAITLSEEKLKLVTVLGAGLLVGTALAVIIPEGVHTLYAAQEQGHAAAREAIAVVKKAADDLVKASGPVQASVQHEHEHGHHHEHSTEMHTWIGVSLVLGFVFMLLVDQLSGGSHSHSPSDSEVGAGGVQKRHNMTATIGLVVHAAADGVALGAAASTSQTDVEMIVFIAIMLHKAPAAFGLVSILLHENFERNRIRKHLAVFSFSAPILAILTYFGLSQTSKEVLSSVNATGIAMLFSAGTFLYVATVHVLPEIASMGTIQTVTPDGTVIIREHKGFSKLELFVMVIGALLPLVLSVGHHH
jgi:zinc transporter 9